MFESYKFGEDDGKDTRNIKNLDHSITKNKIEEEISLSFCALRTAFLGKNKETVLQILRYLIEKEGTDEFNRLSEIVEKENFYALPYIFNSIIPSIDESSKEIDDEIVSICIRLIVCISSNTLSIYDILPDSGCEFIDNLHRLLTTVSNVNCYGDCLCAIKSLLIDNQTQELAKSKFPIDFFDNVIKIIFGFDEETQIFCIDNLVLVFHAYAEMPLTGDESDTIVSLINKSNELISKSEFALTYMLSTIKILIDEDLFNYHLANSVNLIGYINELLESDSLKVIQSAASLMQRIINDNQLPKTFLINMSHLFEILDSDCEQKTYVSVALLIKEIILNDPTNYCHLERLCDLYQKGTTEEKVYIANIIATIVEITNKYNSDCMNYCFNDNVICTLCDALFLHSYNIDMICIVANALGYLKFYAEASGLLEDWYSYIEDVVSDIQDLAEDLEESTFLEIIKIVFQEEDDESD